MQPVFLLICWPATKFEAEFRRSLVVLGNSYHTNNNVLAVAVAIAVVAATAATAAAAAAAAA
eukprot:14466111-Heterocapsa_arctica.AAC.1